MEFEVCLGGFVPEDREASGGARVKGVAGAVDKRIGDEAGDGVHAENEDGHGPDGAAVFDFDEPVEEGKKEKAEAAAQQDEGTGPEIFVDGKPAIPNETGNDTENADENERTDFGEGGLGVAEPVSREDAEERGGDGGDGVENAFGIARAVVEMAHEELAVEPGGDVAVGVHERDIPARKAEAGNGSEAEKGPIAEQADDDGDELAAAGEVEFEDGRSEIAEGDALGDAFEAEGVEVQAVDGRGVDEQADGDEDEGTFEGVKKDLTAGLAASEARGERENDGDADEEEKGRKD